MKIQLLWKAQLLLMKYYITEWCLSTVVGVATVLSRAHWVTDGDVLGCHNWRDVTGIC